MFSLLSSTAAVVGHGAMQYPPTWQDPISGRCGMGPGCFTAGIMYFSNDTQIVGEPTIPEDSALRTYHGDTGAYPGSPGNISRNPWRAPGSAPIFSPCGVLGGNPDGCPKGDLGSKGKACPGGGSGYGPDARNSSIATPWTTEWKRGTVVEAAWGIRANHGGGYSYRMCKRVPGQPFQGLSEQCFQQTPLQFAGDMQWVQFNTSAQRVAFPANGTAVGTVPAGSMWRKNPIPACRNLGGGSMQPRGDECMLYGPQFPSPGTNLDTGRPLMGFCESSRDGWARTACPFAIVDQLQLPASLEPGDWVVSFRWDCEQTPQVWTTCSNVRITA